MAKWAVKGKTVKAWYQNENVNQGKKQNVCVLSVKTHPLLCHVLLTPGKRFLLFNFPSLPSTIAEEVGHDHISAPAFQ